jgi:hypothetical protein
VLGGEHGQFSYLGTAISSVASVWLSSNGHHHVATLDGLEGQVHLVQMADPECCVTPIHWVMSPKAHSYFNYRQNHVCLEHQIASRVESARCPVCGLPMRAIGTRWRVPKKGDKQGWHELQEMLRGFNVRSPSLALFPGVTIRAERLSEYRAEYRLRRIIRRPGS